MKIIVLLSMFLIATTGAKALDSETGIVTGGIIYELPHWFKSSFLDFGEEIDDAREQGKHVMAFMHLDECPYCARMLAENFQEGDNKDFMERYFDVIGINVRGDLDVAWIDGSTYTEKELALRLNAIATPTIVFIDLDGNKVLQLNGYRDPRSFRYALEYVQGRRYGENSFADYLTSLEKPDVYEPRSHPLLQRATYFKDYDKPLVVLFEDSQCAECDRFHDKTLNHPDVMSAMEGYLFVRFDTDSDQKLFDLKGRSTTPGQWARDLGITFRPAIVMFNQGRELYRADGIHYHQHLSEALVYAKRGFLEFDSLDEFKAAYRDALIKSGRNVDFSE